VEDGRPVGSWTAPSQITPALSPRVYQICVDSSPTHRLSRIRASTQRGRNYWDAQPQIHGAVGAGIINGVGFIGFRAAGHMIASQEQGRTGVTRHADGRAFRILRRGIADAVCAPEDELTVIAMTVNEAGEALMLKPVSMLH
jgi:hypothetical protein